MSSAVWLIVALVSNVNDNIRIGLTDSSLEPLESYSQTEIAPIHYRSVFGLF